MDEQGFKKLLNEVLTPLQEHIQGLQEGMNGLQEDVSTLKVSVLSIEQTITSYADSYKENQRNIERLDTRLNAVEEELSIEPSVDLKVPHFAE